MFRKLTMAAVAMSVLAAAGSASASTNLLTNADFELGPASFGTGSNDYYRGIPTGWSAVAGYDVVDIVENGYTQGPPVLKLAESGTHFLDMNGAGSSGAISQLVTGLTAGSVLDLSFWHVKWAQNSASGAIGYQFLDGLTNADLGHGGVTVGVDWAEFMASSAAITGTSVRLVLSGTTAFQAGPGLDNVSLTARGGSDVPEPTVWGLMIVGFGGIGAMLRRRREAAVPA